MKKTVFPFRFLIWIQVLSKKDKTIGLFKDTFFLLWPFPLICGISLGKLNQHEINISKHEGVRDILGKLSEFYPESRINLRNQLLELCGDHKIEDVLDSHDDLTAIKQQNQINNDKESLNDNEFFVVILNPNSKKPVFLRPSEVSTIGWLQLCKMAYKQRIAIFR